MSSRALLITDAAINLSLGMLLLLFPASVVQWLGIPTTTSAFYPSMLGAVLLGIGLALSVEAVRGRGGLGLTGAVIINFIAAFVLALWLLFGALSIPTRGNVVLWGLVALVVAVSLCEVIHLRRVRAAAAGTEES